MSFLAFASDPGEYIGQGATYDYSIADGAWAAEFDTTGPVDKVHITVTDTVGYTWWWELHLAGPIDRGLVPGTYTNASRWPFQNVTDPGLSFYGTGRGCNTVTGSFEVLSITVGPNNHLDQFHATFEQHCEGGPLALGGEISVVTNPWR